jgi:hypothetical protein
LLTEAQRFPENVRRIGLTPLHSAFVRIAFLVLDSDGIADPLDSRSAGVCRP